MLAERLEIPDNNRGQDGSEMTTPALKPFFSYFGAKFRQGYTYPEPEHDDVFEPFAGSAGYSVRHFERNVILADTDPAIASVWKYLITGDANAVARLPVDFDSVDDFDAPDALKYLVGFWLNRAGRIPYKRRSKWAASHPRSASFWCAEVRDRIASQMKLIRHWRFIDGGYRSCESVCPATYFVDPPYQRSGRLYRCKFKEYGALAEWCRSRAGTVIVCEQDGSNWLPFVPHCELTTLQTRGAVGVSREVIYVCRSSNFDAVHKGDKNMEPDDAELADMLGILPKEPEPPFDPAAALELPARERFAVALRELGKAEDGLAAFKNAQKAAYERDLEAKWRAKEPRGRKKFLVSKAETEFPDEAKELVAVARGLIEAYRVGYYKLKDLLEQLARDAARECPIRPGEQRVEYKVVHVGTYQSQTDAAHYAKIRATLYRYDLLAMGVAHAEVEFDGCDKTYCVYADRIHGDDAELLPWKPGETLANQVLLAWRMNANPRVYWPQLPHDFEAKNGFDRFGNWIAPPAAGCAPLPGPFPDLTEPVQVHTPDPAKSSEFVEPEII